MACTRRDEVENEMVMDEDDDLPMGNMSEGMNSVHSIWALNRGDVQSTVAPRYIPDRDMPDPLL